MQLVLFNDFASLAGGLCTCNTAAFASDKKYAAHFLSEAFGVTEPKDAVYAGTGFSAKKNHQL